MRNIGNKTPTTKPEKNQATSEKSSTKKLVQARLPFKIIGSGVLVSASSDVTNAESENAASIATINEVSGESQNETVCKQDVRKRKLSYGEEESASTDHPLVDSKENLTVVTTKKKKTSTSEDVIVLDDSEKEDADTAIKTLEIDAKRNSLATPKVSTASPKTPMQGSKKRKGAGTPNSAGKSGGVRRKQSPRASVAKLQIKLPIIGKKKRRKSQRKSITGETESTSEASSESSDDIEMIAEELNPQKRPKVETSVKEDIKDQEKELDVAQEGKEQTENVETSTDKTPVRQSTRISLATQEDLAQTDHNKQKITKSEDKKDTKITIPDKNKDTLATELEKNKDSETSVKNIEQHNAVTISDEENLVVEKTSFNTSKLFKGKKPLQTLDVFISKEHVATQQEKTNSKQIEPKSKIPKPKKVSEKLKVKHTTAVKNANVSTVDDADDDEDAINSSASSVEEVNLSVTKEKSKAPESPTPGNVSLLNSSNISVDQRKGGLTPKQQKLMEQRRMAREEKERRLQEQKEERERKAQEEKVQKQREKEEKDLAKKREREEKEEQKRKEREEKEEVKRKEREEKERKRLAEIDAKNEERRKRNEVKEEELRKKDEERKRKEQEKEEAEHKKKKAAEAFTKFFVAKNTRLSKAAEAVELASTQEGVEGVSVGENILSESLAFRPFQIKGDMKLAPLCRKVFKDAAREKLDFFLNVASSAEKSPGISKRKPGFQQLYLDELKTGKIAPGKWRRPTVDTKSEDDDVIIIEDELERAAQTIVEETDRTVEHHRAKLYKFHENRRPPYFGTWRKKTSVITARRPLAQDKKYFDYEVDSDLEWEEEEPGESLDGSDEEKEKESEDEDYEVDNEWFVPHGHLSDEELQNEDDCGLGDDNTREAQKAKLKILQQEFAQEMKKKTEKIKPRLIGCIWQDYNGNQPELCPNIIWNSLNLRAMLYTVPPLVEEPLIDSVSEANELGSPTNSTSVAGAAEKLKRILLTEDMLKDLIRLVHGNRHSKVFLINEFIAHIEQTENAIKNGDVRGPLKSVVRDKIDEFALWQVVESHNNMKSKKKNKKKLCWLVSEDKLKKYNLQSLEVHNKWTYTLPPKFVETNSISVNEPTLNEEEAAEVPGSTTSEKSSSSKSNSQKISKKEADVITKFTKVLTTEEKAKQIQQNAVASKVDIATKAQTNKRSTPKGKSSSSSAATSSQHKQPTTPIVKKRVPLLMSVARGQQIPTPTKNALISQFLKKGKDNTPDNTETSVVDTTKMDTDEVVILD